MATATMQMLCSDLHSQTIHAAINGAHHQLLLLLGVVWADGQLLGMD
jgi:hypothetical protein